MATITKDVSAPPADVWAVLANGWLFPSWVVGASRMRDVDADWPSVGARLHHSVGVWPMLLDDTTRVLESEPARRLVLQARAWPVGEARVELRIEPMTDPHGRPAARLTIEEAPNAGPGLAFFNPISDALLAKRNAESLNRLAALAEGAAGAGEGSTTAR